MNRFNRPSVIVFNTDNIRSSVIVPNPNYIQIRDNVIIDNQNNEIENIDELSNISLENNSFENNDNVRDSVIINNRNNEIENIDEDSNDSFDNYFDNNSENNDNIVSRRSELSDEEYLNIIRSNYEMQHETNQYSRLYGLMFSHFKTKINPNIYQELQPDNFVDLFRDIFQDIFNRVLEKVVEEYPDKFEFVKVNIKGKDVNINLQFADMVDITSDLFIIELYRLLQSKRDVICNSELELSFTFLPKKH